VVRKRNLAAAPDTIFSFCIFIATAMSTQKKECPSCAMQIDADAEVCPVCEYEFPSQTKYQWIAAIMIIASILVILFYLLR
jgi:RNA polymerase subunit RPABC4/transcription elongation factor Spt4